MVQAHAAATGLPQLAHLPQSSHMTGHASQQMAQWAQQPGQPPANMQPRQFSGQQAPSSMQHQQVPQHEVPQQQPPQAAHSGVRGCAQDVLMAQGATRAAASSGRPTALLWHEVYVYGRMNGVLQCVNGAPCCGESASLTGQDLSAAII